MRLTAEKSKYLVVAGGVLLALSVFIPWIHVFLLGNLTFMQLASMNHSVASAWLLAGGGLSAALIAYMYEDKISLRNWVSFLSAAYGLLQGFQFYNALRKVDGIAEIQLGVYLAIASGVLSIIGIVSHNKSDDREVEKDLP